MTERSPRSDRIVAAAAAAVAVAALASVRLDDLGTLVAFTALIAASELFEVSLHHNNRYTLGLAPAIGLALLGRIHPEPMTHPALAQVLAAFAVGMLLAMGLRALARREVRAVDAAARMLALAAGAGVYRAVLKVDAPVFDVTRSDTSTDISYAGFAALFLAVLLVQTFITTMRTVERDRVPARPVFRGALDATFALHLSVVSVGALLAVAYPALRYWAFPLFLAPLAATQFAFRQFDSIRRTYLQTIRALSKVPEMAGYTHPGHSRRVAELAVAIAREMGMQESQIPEVEYAALLHDIGRVSIPDPTQATDSGSLELAVVGAAIVRETGHFPRVADMIEHLHEPYRRRGEGANDDLPIGSKIIKVASAYDDMTRPGGIGLNRMDALDRLSLGMAFDYDPAVVQGLRRVLEKQGAL